MTRAGWPGSAGLWARSTALAMFLMISRAGAAAPQTDDSTEVEALIREGVSLRQSGKDERALPVFQKAYHLVRSPRTAGQLGLVQMAMGYWLDAEQHLTEALESPDHPWVAKNRAGLEGALANLRSKIGEITIGGAVPGAAVQVNGRMAGTIPLPAPIRLAKGKVEIRVSVSRGRPSSLQRVDLARGRWPAAG